MAKVKASTRVEHATAQEVEALWHDPSRWTGFVDGFGALEREEGDWPSVGARVVWNSRPGGRGRVVEKVLEHRPGERHVVAVEDSEITATQTLLLDADAADRSVRMVVELEFARKDAGPIAQVGQSLFVRSALKASLRRTLSRFGQELASERELTAE